VPLLKTIATLLPCSRTHVTLSDVGLCQVHLPSDGLSEPVPSVTIWETGTYGVPPVLPVPWRPTDSLSKTEQGGRTLEPTTRFEEVSTALQTAPNPPFPILLGIRHFPHP
jgi:hypothetical protein